jgi:hypothetical protein
MSQYEQSDVPEGERRPEEEAPKWAINAYATWLTTATGQDWIRAKKSMQAVRDGEEPPHGWPVDLRGGYVPAEGPLRVRCRHYSERSAPDGWVLVGGFSDLRQLMLAQLVVEFSINDAHEAVDFIAANYHGYGSLFWPRDGFTETHHDEARVDALVEKARALADFGGVRLVTTRDADEHLQFATTRRE